MYKEVGKVQGYFCFTLQPNNLQHTRNTCLLLGYITTLWPTNLAINITTMSEVGQYKHEYYYNINIMHELALHL